GPQVLVGEHGAGLRDDVGRGRDEGAVDPSLLGAQLPDGDEHDRRADRQREVAHATPSLEAARITFGGAWAARDRRHWSVPSSISPRNRSQSRAWSAPNSAELRTSAERGRRNGTSTLSSTRPGRADMTTTRS